MDMRCMLSISLWALSDFIPNIQKGYLKFIRLIIKNFVWASKKSIKPFKSNSKRNIEEIVIYIGYGQ